MRFGRPEYASRVGGWDDDREVGYAWVGVRSVCVCVCVLDPSPRCPGLTEAALARVEHVAGVDWVPGCFQPLHRGLGHGGPE